MNNDKNHVCIKENSTEGVAIPDSSLFGNTMLNSGFTLRDTIMRRVSEKITRKVNYKGERKAKKSCPAGQHSTSTGNSTAKCVADTTKQKLARISLGRKIKNGKKKTTSGQKNQAKRRTKKANKKRQGLGL